MKLRVQCEPCRHISYYETVVHCFKRDNGRIQFLCQGTLILLRQIEKKQILFFSFCFLGLHPQLMEVPRLGV